jgi:predicted CoA-substrate-specific enzyme activase
LISVGIDAGGERLKTVIFSENGIVSWAVIPYKKGSVLTHAEAALDEALLKGRVQRDQIGYIVATGSEGEEVRFADERLLDASCCVRGVLYRHPSTRTVVDIGADKIMVLRIQDGTVMRSARNDKCASGTSRYLKTVCRVLQVDEEEAARLSLQSQKPADLKSSCAVFVESEIISLIHGVGLAKADILRGAFNALATDIYSLLVKVSFQKDVTITGGLAGNLGIVRAIEEQIGFSTLVPEEPGIVVALGASILAYEKLQPAA